MFSRQLQVFVTVTNFHIRVPRIFAASPDISLFIFRTKRNASLSEVIKVVSLLCIHKQKLSLKMAKEVSAEFQHVLVDNIRVCSL